MTWNGTDSNGNKHLGIERFIDKDHVEWSMVFTNPDGMVVLELSTNLALLVSVLADKVARGS